MSHIAPEQLEQYVIGALDPTTASLVEAHTASCADCALALQREAQLELGLAAVAALPAPLNAVRRRRRVGVAAAGVALAASAAAAVLVFALFERPPSPESAPRIARCDHVGASSECIARAQFDGVLTIGPGQQVVVPRYDEMGAP
jgi:anti-sigma factor RsiW